MEFEGDAFSHGQLPSSLELAFVGDSVYDLYVRSNCVKNGGKLNEAHRAAVKCVNAHAQALALAKIEADLTEQEQGVVRRARNARQTPTKNADAADYHRATALEALIGYLYLTGQNARMKQILEMCVSWEGNEHAESI